MRHFVRQSIKQGRCNAFNQHYKSEISDEVFDFISKELDINGDMCEISEKYFKFLGKYEKRYAKEFDSKYDDYRDIDRKEKTDFINKKLNMLVNHKDMSKLDSNKTQMDYDATSLYTFAMWNEKSVFSKIKSGFVFKPHMKDVYVEAFNNQTFNEDGNEYAMLRIKIIQST